MMQLKLLRVSRGLTQEQLSKSSGVSRTIIGRLESPDGCDTLLSTLYKLAKALDVSVADFFTPVV